MKEETLSVSRKRNPYAKRIVAIDLVRGLCMFLVFFDHIMWCLGYFFPTWASALGLTSGFLVSVGDFANFYYSNPARRIVQFLALSAFVFISGISCSFSKNNYKRSAKMVAFWFIIWIGSNVVNAFWSSGSVINFNVIGVIAFSCLFYCFFQNKSWKIITINILLLILFWEYVLPNIYLAFKDSAVLAYPLWNPTSAEAPIWDPTYVQHDVYVNGQFYFQADYMYLFPYIIVFFLGVLFAKFFYAVPSEHVGGFKEWMRPITFIGRHSLIFYLTHQIIIMGIFSLIGLAFRG